MEFHLGRVYRKLGVRSRGGLTKALAVHGLMSVNRAFGSAAPREPRTTVCSPGREDAGVTRGLATPPVFFARPPWAVAPDLLGCVLESESDEGVVVVRLVEVEAYAGGEDPASHAWRGRTTRNAAMYGPPGTLYVYFVYGMHWCAQHRLRGGGDRGRGAAARGRGGGGGRAARPGAADGAARDLARGPARLAQALGVDGAANGADLSARTHGLLVCVRGRPAPPRRSSGPAGGGGPGGRHPLAVLDRRRPGRERLPTRRPGAAPRCGRIGRVTHILDELRWRGVLAQTTDPDALRAALDAGPVTFYCGFDPTAPEPALRQPRSSC